MSVVVGASAHGSPGVTTCLEILAAVAPSPTVLVEASAGGGTLAARHTLPLAPGMSGLAEALRRGEAPDILDYSQRLPSGVPFVALSPSVLAARAQQTLASAAMAGYLARVEHAVLVDLGLVWPTTVAESILVSADRVLWFVRPLREEVAHLVARLKELPTHSAQVVTVGSSPYSSADVGEVVGLPATAIAYDDKGAAAFRFGGEDRKLQRSRLARSIRTFADTVFAASTPAPGGTAPAAATAAAAGETAGRVGVVQS